jgi:hypothetical protein
MWDCVVWLEVEPAYCPMLSRGAFGFKLFKEGMLLLTHNPYVERFGETSRRELSDKIIVFNRTQLHRVITQFVSYYLAAYHHVCFTLKMESELAR